MFVSLGRFRSVEMPGMGPCWCPPEGVTALIDLVPPGQDADPEVNFGMMLSDAPLDSEDAHYSFGSGNVTEMNLTGPDRDAWQAVTGFRPTAGTIAEALAEHLLTGSDPTGLDYSRPLTAGRNRRLEIHLGGEVWSHTLADWNDSLALPVMRVETKTLAEIYREQGELQYRLAMGGLHRKYNFYGPVKHLIAWLYPAGRDDLPLMDELWPQTVITETFPSVSAITTGQDNAWTVPTGSVTITPAGTATGATGSTVNTALLSYTFGGSDRIAEWVQGSVAGSLAAGLWPRVNATLQDGYLFSTTTTAVLSNYKQVSGSFTVLYSGTGRTAGDALYGSVVGSTLVTKVNGVQVDSRTDTSVASGTRSALRLNHVGATPTIVGPVSFDDTISASGNRRRRVICAGA